jgi:hypothetical protein
VAEDRTAATPRAAVYFLRWALAIYAFGWTLSFGWDAEAASPERWYLIYLARGYHRGR